MSEADPGSGSCEGIHVWTERDEEERSGLKSYGRGRVAWAWSGWTISCARYAGSGKFSWRVSGGWLRRRIREEMEDCFHLFPPSIFLGRIPHPTPEDEWMVLFGDRFRFDFHLAAGGGDCQVVTSIPILPGDWLIDHHYPARLLMAE